MIFLYNLLPLLLISFFLSFKLQAQTPRTLSSEAQTSADKSQFPAQVLNLSSDERVSTNVLLADKSKRLLSVVDKETLQTGLTKESYNIDIGKNSGDKKKRDDHRTPEGIYKLLERKTPPEIPFETYGSMAFTTNYPNYFDRYENKTGSGIWLHSVPDDVPLTRGSRGCVVLRNDDIKKIESNIKLKRTLMVIDNKINWVTKDTHEQNKQLVITWLENWRKNWETQNLNTYIDNYADDFSIPPFNKKTWLNHKEKLKERYTYVKVQISEPTILQHKKQYIIQFVQDYESDGHKDTGIKTLYVVQNQNSLKIKREEWAALD